MALTMLATTMKARREARGLTIDQAARKLKLSKSYLYHLERPGGSSTVPISEDLEGRIVRLYGFHAGRFHAIVESQNKIARAYYRGIRLRAKKRAATGAKRKKK